MIAQKFTKYKFKFMAGECKHITTQDRMRAQSAEVSAARTTLCAKIYTRRLESPN